jgi:hypothetical protein
LWEDNLSILEMVGWESAIRNEVQELLKGSVRISEEKAFFGGVAGLSH